MDWTLYKMIRDNENNIIPQMLIPGTGFRPLTGEAVDVGRYGYDSVVWGKTSGGVFVPVQVDTEGKQAVTASELEAKMDALNAKLDGVIDGTTPAKTEAQLTGSLIADEEAVPVKRVGREYASNTSSSVDNQEVPAGGFVNYKVDLKGYGHVVSSVVTSASAPNTNGNYKAINELGSLWGTLVSKDYTVRSFTSEPLQILGDAVVFRYQNNSEAPVVLLRLRYYAF